MVTSAPVECASRLYGASRILKSIKSPYTFEPDRPAIYCGRLMAISGGFEPPTFSSAS